MGSSRSQGCVAMSWLLPGHPSPQAISMRSREWWAFLRVHLGVELRLRLAHYVGGWTREQLPYPASPRVTERHWTPGLQGQSCVYFTSGQCLRGRAYVCTRDWPGSGHTRKGRGSWLEAPKEGLTQQAVLGGSRPGGAEVGVGDTAGNRLEQRGGR